MLCHPILLYSNFPRELPCCARKCPRLFFLVYSSLLRYLLPILCYSILFYYNPCQTCFRENFVAPEKLRDSFPCLFYLTALFTVLPIRAILRCSIFFFFFHTRAKLISERTSSLRQKRSVALLCSLSVTPFCIIYFPTYPVLSYYIIF